MSVTPKVIDSAAADQVFREARTTYNWLPDAVSDEALAQAWDLAKFGPTAMNCQPMRVKVIHPGADRDKLRAQAAGGNQGSIDNAPLQLLLYWTPKFYERMAEFFPANPGIVGVLAENPAMAKAMAQTNCWLQAAYLIIALRAVGLAVGPMTGANFPAIDKEFFNDDAGHAFLILNVGYAAATPNNFPRSPRLSWQEATA
jgi:3-hydroxypropanoate dehydrogenase